MSEVNRERMEMLCSALESGQYEQGKYSLAYTSPEGEARYCCLGVACEVAMANGLNIEKTVRPGGDAEYDEWNATLPPSVREWFGLDPDESDPELRDAAGARTNATYVNDTLGKTFPEIAEAFRRTYLSEEGE